MVAARSVVSRRLRIFYQPMLLDLQMRMRFVVGRSGHGVQYPHGSRQTLPLLRSRLAGPVARDDRDHRSATLPDPKNAMDVAHPRSSRAGNVPSYGGLGRAGSRLVGRVLEPLGLADPTRLPAYLNCLWYLNRPTYCSLQWSSGSPSKSSTGAEAGAAVVCAFPQISTKFRTILLQSRDHREWSQVNLA
jgi:hypothetical protein